MRSVNSFQKSGNWKEISGFRATRARKAFQIAPILSNSFQNGKN